MAYQRPPSSTSLSFRLRLTKAHRELHSAIENVLKDVWNQTDRDRVSEIASTLAEACRREGLREAAAVARSIASLMRVSPEQILSVEIPFREKIDELLSILETTTIDLLNGTG